METKEIIKEIAKMCVKNIPHWKERAAIADDTMDEMRCSLQAASDLYESILSQIDEYGEYNEIDVEDIDPEDVYAAVADLKWNTKRGVVVDADRRVITIVPIAEGVIDTPDWRDSIENIDGFLQKAVGCKGRKRWDERFSFFILHENEDLNIIEL